MSDLMVGIPTRVVASRNSILAGYSGAEVVYGAEVVPYDLASYEAHQWAAGVYAHYTLDILTDTPIVAIHEYRDGYLFLVLLP